MTSEDKKERPVSMICEATNYNLTSDYAAHPMSPVGRVSFYVQIKLKLQSFSYSTKTVLYISVPLKKRKKAYIF